MLMPEGTGLSQGTGTVVGFAKRILSFFTWDSQPLACPPELPFLPCLIPASP